MDEERIGDLLIQWSLAREAGREQSVDELCADFPELAEEVARRVRSVAAMDWLLDDDEQLDDSELSLPGIAALAARVDDEKLPLTSLSRQQFLAALVGSGLKSEGEVDSLRRHPAAADTREFAAALVAAGRLTRYQAAVLLEQSDKPLILDQYEILRPLDSGGMGIVYQAVHRSMDRIVALKTLPKKAVDSLDKVRRFQQEAIACAKLQHPNIVTMYDARHTDGAHFLVMEYIDGKDLSKVVAMHGCLPVGKAVHFALQAARGLAHAHRQNVIHRDIKPGNLVLDRRETVKILDLGLARIESLRGGPRRQDLTSSGYIMGTASYMAPEQALDAKAADHRSDVYSLGCTLYFLLAGRAPFVEDTVMKTIMAHQQKPIPRLADIRADAPPRLDQVLQRMLAKEPDRRYPSMEDVIEALEACGIRDDQPPLDLDQPIRDRPASETKAPATTSRLIAYANSSVSRRALPLAASAVFLLVVLALAAIAWNTRTPEMDASYEQPGASGAHSLAGEEIPPTIASSADSDRVASRDAGPPPDAERAVAQWALRQGGSVTVEMAGGSLLRLGPNDSVPPAVGAVRELDLTSKKNLPTEEIQPLLGRLSGVRILSLNHSNATVEMVRALAAKGSITRFNVLGIQLWDALLAEIVDTNPNLQSVNLMDAGISGKGLACLARAPKMTSAWLSGPGISLDELQPLCELPRLHFLSLDNVLVTADSIRILAEISQLDDLRIHGASFAEESIVQRICAIDGIQSLEFERITELRDPWLAHVRGLANLRNLNLIRVPISDAGLEHVARMTQLRQVELSETDVTSVGVQRLLDSLPDCEIVWNGARVERETREE